MASEKLLLLATHAFCLLLTCYASPVFQAYRLVQYDHDGTPSGSRTARLSQYAALKKEGVTLFRSVVLLPIREATLQVVKEILDPGSGVAGLVFLLPNGADLVPGAMDDSEFEILMELEKYLILNAISIPVYFVEENGEMHNIVMSINEAIKTKKPPSNLHGGYLCQVKSGSIKPIKRPGIHNFEGWLKGSEEAKVGRPSSPTIVISAHYDGCIITPGMPGGGNGSGIVTLLSLIRYFSTFYKNPATRPRFNMLFLLTGGAGMDFNGLRYWLKSAETRVLDSVQFVLTLDTLTGPLTDGRLYFHYSRPPKDPLAAEWYTSFKNAAEMDGVQLTMIQKKINLALPYMTWEHEHFAQQKTLGATLSGLKEGGNPMFRSSLLERTAPIDQATLMKIIKIVGNAVTPKLYENNKQPFYNASTRLPGLQSNFIDKWTSSLRQIPRTAPFIELEGPFASMMLRFLKQHTDKGTSISLKNDPLYRFYDNISVELRVFQTPGVLFDVLLFVIVLVYLSLLFFTLKVVTQGWKAFISLFTPAKYNWKKNSSVGRRNGTK